MTRPVTADKEVAEHPAPVLDGDAEKVGERRMVRRVIRETRMPADIVEQDRAFLEERAENAVRSWQRSDGCRNALADAQRGKARESTAAVGNPDRPVSSGRLPSRRANDPLEPRGEVRGGAESQQVGQTARHRT